MAHQRLDLRNGKSAIGRPPLSIGHSTYSCKSHRESFTFSRVSLYSFKFIFIYWLLQNILDFNARKIKEFKSSFVKQ